MSQATSKAKKKNQAKVQKAPPPGSFELVGPPRDGDTTLAMPAWDGTMPDTPADRFNTAKAAGSEAAAILYDDVTAVSKSNKEDTTMSNTPATSTAPDAPVYTSKWNDFKSDCKLPLKDSLPENVAKHLPAFIGNRNTGKVLVGLGVTAVVTAILAAKCRKNRKAESKSA